MRKRNLLWTVAALMLTACTSSDEPELSPEQPENIITFDNPFVKKSTRATGDLTTTNIGTTNIKVWGDKYTASGGTTDNVFDATSGSADVSATLTHDEVKPVWNCNKIALWEAAYTYDFTAVAPATVSATYSTDQTTLAGRKLSISDIPVVQPLSNADGNKIGDDMLVAVTLGQTSTSAGNDGVQLSFKHILSRFSVYAYTTATTPITITALKFYLPADGTTATYTQNVHGAVTAGTDAWAWTGFTNKENATAAAELATAYKDYDIVTTATEALPVCDSPSKAIGTAIKLPQEFFIAPTAVKAVPNTVDLQLYMEITFTYNGVDYSKFCPVQDLHSFTQGYQTNLYICVNEPKQAVYFNSLSVNGWADDDHTTSVSE